MPRFVRKVLKSLVSKPATRPYPFTKRAAIGGSRGQLHNNVEACIFCGICAKRCPSIALEVTKNPKVWSFNRYKCIVCGYCVDVCPKKCLAMQPEHATIAD